MSSGVVRYRRSLNVLMGLAAVLAAGSAFVVTFPQDSWKYLTGFAWSCGVVITASAVASVGGRMFRAAPTPVMIPAIAGAYFLLISGFYLFASAIELRRPEFPIADWVASILAGDWLAPGWRQARVLGARSAIVVSVMVIVDILLQVRRTDGSNDFAYYPRLRGVARSLSLVRGRMVLVAGFLVLFAGYARIALEAWAYHPRERPENAFVTCVFGWALLWIVDSLSRRRNTTLWVPIAFALCGFVWSPP